MQSGAWGVQGKVMGKGELVVVHMYETECAGRAGGHMYETECAGHAGGHMCSLSQSYSQI